MFHKHYADQDDRDAAGEELSETMRPYHFPITTHEDWCGEFDKQP